MKHLGLFEGIGGFSLAAKWMGWETVAWCEWDQFGQRVLKYYFPNAEGFGDITKTDFTKYANTIDILTGGFPCQGFSLAGGRLGTDDDRYLWPEMLRAIDETKPTYIIGENVTGILSMEDKSGIYRDVFAKVEDRKITRFAEVDYYEAIYTRQVKMLVNSICEDLEKRGYEVQTMAIPAASVGAPHKRERIWFIAHSVSAGMRSTEYRNFGQGGKLSEASQPKMVQQENWKAFQQEHPNDGELRIFTNATGNGGDENNGGGESRLINEKSEANYWQNFPTQSPIYCRNDGVPRKLDGITFSNWRNKSIKAFGNAIVPQVAFEILKVIDKMAAPEQP